MDEVSNDNFWSVLRNSVRVVDAEERDAWSFGLTRICRRIDRLVPIQWLSGCTKNVGIAAPSAMRLSIASAADSASPMVTSISR